MDKFLELLSENEKALYDLLTTSWNDLPGFAEIRSSQWFNKHEIQKCFNDLGSLLLANRESFHRTYDPSNELRAYRAVRVKKVRAWLLSLPLINEEMLQGPEQFLDEWPGLVYAYRLKRFVGTLLVQDPDWNSSVYRVSMSNVLKQVGVESIHDLVAALIYDPASLSSQIIASDLPNPQASWHSLLLYLDNKELPRQRW